LISGKRASKWVVNALMGLFVASAVVLIAVKFAVGWYWTIPQNGMYPTLPAGSTFFGINKPYRDVKGVKRGDIVIFERFEGGSRYIYIWRVVGLPGDAVEIDDARVTLNGKGLPQEKVRSEGGYEIFRETNGDASYEVAYEGKVSEGLPRTLTLTVPDDHLFVLGDNRQNASDSRRMGPIRFDSVVAKKW